MNIGDGLRVIFDLSQTFVLGLGNVWNWLVSLQGIGFNVPIIGFIGFEFVPLYWILGGGFLVALGFALAKLIPFL